MTTEIKCANCLATAQRAFGPAEDATAPWLCPECDANEGVAVDDGSDVFGSERQLRDADEFNGEESDAPYVRYLKAEGLLGDNFPDDPQPKAGPVLVDDGQWFEEHAGVPTKTEIAFTEKRLAKYGLSENIVHSQQDIQPVVVPIIEGTEFQGDVQVHQFDRRMDGGSLRAAASHCAHGSELRTIHRVRTRKRERQIPAWALDDKRVRQVILKEFPKLVTNARQRALAGRWARVLYLYFRVCQWDKTIAEVAGCTVRAVEGVIRRAREVGEELFGAARSASLFCEGDYWCCSAFKAA